MFRKFLLSPDLLALDSSEDLHISEEGTSKISPNPLLIFQSLVPQTSTTASKYIFESTEPSIDLRESQKLSSQNFFKRPTDKKFLSNLPQISLETKPSKSDQKFFSACEFPTPSPKSRSQSCLIKNTPKQVMANWNFQFRKQDKKHTREEKQQLWKTHKYKNLLLNPDTEDEVFLKHLKAVYQSLVRGTKMIKPPCLNLLQKKSVVIAQIGIYLCWGVLKNSFLREYL